MSKFSETLKLLRHKNNITQSELAKSLGISRSAIGMYESGVREPDFETLEAIADYFNVDMNKLIGKKQTLITDTSDEVAPIEKDFLKIFRQLTPENQENYINFLRSLADSQKD